MFKIRLALNIILGPHFNYHIKKKIHKFLLHSHVELNISELQEFTVCQVVFLQTSFPCEADRY